MRQRLLEVRSAKFTKHIQEVLNTRHAQGKGAKVKIISREGFSPYFFFHCGVHGRWKDRGSRIIYNMSFTCPQCAKERDRVDVQVAYERFCEAWRNRRNRNLRFLPGQAYTGSNTRLKGVCKKHSRTCSIVPNSFVQNYKTALLCHDCVQEGRVDTRYENGYMWDLQSVNVFLKNCNSTVRCLDWNGTTKQATFQCLTYPEHVWQSQGQAKLYKGTGCPKCCNNGPSKDQVSLWKFVHSICPDAKLEVAGHEVLGKNRKETGIKAFDIWVPSKKLVIELDGVYWHSDDFDEEKNAGKNRNRLKQVHASGLHLIAITDLEWQEKRYTFEAYLSRILGVRARTTIGARKASLSIEKINDEHKKFLNRHHLQGSVRAGICSVLRSKEHSGKILALMVFEPARSVRGMKKTEGVMELSRFCVRSYCHSPGAAFRLFKALVKETKPKSVISYSHNQWFDGGVYEALKFTKVGTVPPDYRTWWGARFKITGLRSKQFSRRKNLEKILGDDFCPELSESENLLRAGVRRIRDYGKIKWQFLC